MAGDNSKDKDNNKGTDDNKDTDDNQPHIQGTFLIENSSTKRHFTSIVPSNLTETPLYLWPLYSFNPYLIQGHFDVEYTGKNQEYYIRNSPSGVLPLYLAHNAPSAPVLTEQRQTCRIIPTSFRDTYFISTEPSDKASPGVLTDANAETVLIVVQPDVERLDKTDTRQMWIFTKTS